MLRADMMKRAVGHFPLDALLEALRPHLPIRYDHRRYPCRRFPAAEIAEPGILRLEYTSNPSGVGRMKKGVTRNRPEMV